LPNALDRYALVLFSVAEERKLYHSYDGRSAFGPAGRQAAKADAECSNDARSERNLHRVRPIPPFLSAGFSIRLSGANELLN
jgi:hypothetical protein